MAKELIRLSMACSCGEDGKNHCRNLRRRAIKLLPGTWKQYRGTFVTRVIMEIAWKYRGRVEIVADQWCGILVKMPKKSVYVECDRIEDGLALLVVKLDQMHKEAVI